MRNYDRREFLKASVAGAIGLNILYPGGIISSIMKQESSGTRVSITAGGNRADMAFRALQPFAKEIKMSIGNRRVILKPNNVLIYVPLACTLEGFDNYGTIIRP